jgi:hypothetical protein
MRFNIRQGHFTSGIHIGLHTGRVSQTYKVRFDSSCLYEDIDWERDWNKLDGWSFSNLPFYYEVEKKWQAPHHNNSVRLAWRSNIQLGKIELALYYYQNGVRFIVPFIMVDVDKEYTVGIFYKYDEIDGEVHNPRILTTCTNKDDPFYATLTTNLAEPFKVIPSYKLYPYFGGSSPAPHSMFILSEET